MNLERTTNSRAECVWLWFFALSFASLHYMVGQSELAAHKDIDDSVWTSREPVALVVASSKTPTVAVIEASKEKVHPLISIKSKAVRSHHQRRHRRTKSERRRSHQQFAYQTKIAISREREASIDKVPLPYNEAIAQRALRVARNMNSVGWCLRGVSRALNPLGIHLNGAAAYQAKAQLLRDKRFHQVRSNEAKNLIPGDILVHDASCSHRHGHIAVYVGNDREASDHIQRVMPKSSDGELTIFRSISSEIVSNQ